MRPPPPRHAMTVKSRSIFVYMFGIVFSGDVTTEKPSADCSTTAEHPCSQPLGSFEHEAHLVPPQSQVVNSRVSRLLLADDVLSASPTDELD